MILDPCNLIKTSFIVTQFLDFKLAAISSNYLLKQRLNDCFLGFAKQL